MFNIHVQSDWLPQKGYIGLNIFSFIRGKNASIEMIGGDGIFNTVLDLL